MKRATKLELFGLLFALFCVSAEGIALSEAEKPFENLDAEKPFENLVWQGLQEGE
jgi:hypothetical protein